MMKAVWAIVVIGGCVVAALGCKAVSATGAKAGVGVLTPVDGIVRERELVELPEAEGRLWSEVEVRFATKGFVRVSSHESQYTLEYVYLIQRGAWTSKGGVVHDLVVDVTVDNRDPAQVASAHRGHVLDVQTGLAATPDRLFSELVSEGLYPSGTAAKRCLATRAFGEAVKEYPYLKRISVMYGVIRDYNQPAQAYGFHVRVDLGKSQGADRPGWSSYFTVDCGVDPERRPSGDAAPRRSMPRPVLGEVRQWGSIGR